MLFLNLECFQGTSFIFLYFPQPIKKSHQSSSKVLFWIAESLTFNLHHDTDLCLSNSLNPLVSVFGPLLCLPCMLNIKVFQIRERHLQDFCSTQNSGPSHTNTSKWLISRWVSTLLQWKGIFNTEKTTVLMKDQPLEKDRLSSIFKDAFRNYSSIQSWEKPGISCSPIKLSSPARWDGGPGDRASRSSSISQEQRTEN